MSADVLPFKCRPKQEPKKPTPQQAKRQAIIDRLYEGTDIDELVLECVMRVLEIKSS
jgi:hypothetical protein